MRHELQQEVVAQVGRTARWFPTRKKVRYLTLSPLPWKGALVSISPKSVKSDLVTYARSEWFCAKIICNHKQRRTTPGGRCKGGRVFKFYFLMFISETEHKWVRGRERGRHRIRSRLQILSCQHRAQRGARTHEL